MSRGEARCPSCGAAVAPSFPGGAIPCACGATVVVALPSGSPEGARDRESGPYRTAGRAEEVSGTSPTCPFCGHEVPPLARDCPTCDVRLERARCPRCFTLGAPGAYTCARCGGGLPRDVLFDAADAPCPRCATPLAAAGTDEPVHACGTCGGVFVTRDVLARALAAAEDGRIAIAHEGEGRARLSGEDEPRYLPCPLCHVKMNRAALGRGSGVVVDACARHGAWFDAGELTRVLVSIARRA